MCNRLPNAEVAAALASRAELKSLSLCYVILLCRLWRTINSKISKAAVKEYHRKRFPEQLQIS